MVSLLLYIVTFNIKSASDQAVLEEHLMLVSIGGKYLHTYYHYRNMLRVNTRLKSEEEFSLKNFLF